MGLFHNIFGLPQTAQTSGSSGVKRTASSSGKDSVTLTKGEVVKGEVTDLRSNEVTIRLDDGKTLHAKLNSAMELSIGQKAEFFVQETNDVLITLKLLSDGDTSFAEAAIDKALLASGLPNNAHTAELVRSLLTAGLPASKEMIQKMMQYSAANKDVELSTLTALLKNNLPVTKENAAQLQAYRNFEHRLLGQAETMTNTLTNAFSYGEATPAFTEKLLTTFFSEATPSGDTSLSANGMPASDTASAQSMTAQTTASSAEGTLSALTAPSGEVLSQETLLQGTPGTQEASISGTNGQVSISAAQQNNPQAEVDITSTMTTSFTENATESGTASSSVSEASLPLKQLLTDSAHASVQHVLESLPSDIPEFVQIKTNLADGTLTANQLFSALANASANGHSDKVTALLKEEPALSDLFGKTILEQFVMTPEDIQKDNAIEDFYSRMTRTLSSLSELTSSETASAAMKTVADTAAGMQENIQFMNTLNQIFPYVQLPLKLTEQLTHGELYVYTKKKDLSAKDKEVSILLHLDMDSLGPTDVHLSLLRESVTAKFYLNESDAGALVTEQLPSLVEALQKKGYTLNASVLQRTKEPDIVSDFLADGDATPMKRFRFDIRA